LLPFWVDREEEVFEDNGAEFWIMTTVISKVWMSLIELTEIYQFMNLILLKKLD